MNTRALKKIFQDTDYVHRSGTPEELRAAEYLKARCEELGVPARLESFPVPMAEMEEARVFADGKEIPCRGFFCCGSGEEEGELYYMPGQDKVSMAGARDKIVLLDTQGIGFFPYQDLMKAGAKAILFQYGNLHYPNRDIDERDLRAHVVGEERGLLGSKAYVRDHEAELEKTALNINLDMIGTIMGKFIARISAEEALSHYIRYMGAELGFPVEAKVGVYSSDSTPFADKGVPALSLARIAGGSVAPIHCRYDRPDVLSMEQLQKDIAFIAEFTRRMAQSAVCPVSREIPEKVKKELDEYLFRKRKGE